MNHFIDDVVYNQSNCRLQYYQVLVSEMNPKTGVNDRQYNVKNINKAVILPLSKIRTFNYDLSFIAANKNFTFGALYDLSKFIGIIRKRDLKLTPVLNDHIISNNIKYEIKEIDDYEDGYILTLNVADSASNNKYCSAETKLEFLQETES